MTKNADEILVEVMDMGYIPSVESERQTINVENVVVVIGVSQYVKVDFEVLKCELTEKISDIIFEHDKDGDMGIAIDIIKCGKKKLKKIEKSTDN